MKVNLRIAIVIAVLLLLSGCSQGSKPVVTPSPTPTITPTGSIDRNAVYTEAVAYLQSFLDSWRMNGFYAAGQKYLDPRSQSNQKQGNPVLIGGTVTSTHPYEWWVSTDHFTLL